MASNEHVDFRKIENFVRSKRKTNFRKPCKNFKIVDEIGKEGTKLWEKRTPHVIVFQQFSQKMWKFWLKHQLFALKLPKINLTIK